jgi:hypothetical protein
MKIAISVTGQYQRRLAERVEQLVRARVANVQPATEHDAAPPAPPPAQRPQRPDRRS